MTEHPIYAVYGRNLWRILYVVIFLGLMWAGYHYISLINTPPPETENEKPVVAPVIPVEETVDPADELLELKLERDRERSRDAEEVQALLQKENLSSETRKQAEQEWWRLSRAAAKERELENLLKARGYPSTMVTITQKMVMIVLAGKLDPSKAGAIAELAVEVTGIGLDRIEIVER